MLKKELKIDINKNKNGDFDMRLNQLKESAPGLKGKTTAVDAQEWLEKCKNGDATAKDLALYKQLQEISKKLGGRTTVIEVLKAM